MSKQPTLPRMHTSMRGVQLNMEEMRSQNEQSVAVTGQGSSLRMNARGDSLAAGGRIDRRREVIDQDYATQLSGKVKNVDVRAVAVDTFETPAQALDRMRKEKETTARAEKPVEQKVEAPKDESPFEETSVDPTPAVQKPARKLIEKDD